MLAAPWPEWRFTPFGRNTHLCFVCMSRIVHMCIRVFVYRCVCVCFVYRCVCGTGCASWFLKPACPEDLR